jgi:hypothetical protein
MSLFDIHSPLTKFEQLTAMAPVTMSSTQVICKSPRELARLAAMVKAQDDVIYLSHGDWSMHDLVKVLVDQVAPCNLYLSTWSMTEFPLRQILQLQMDGLLTSVNMLLDKKSKVRYPAVYQLAQNISNTISLTDVHAKVTILEGNSSTITIINSQNWTENKRIETGWISRQSSVAEFHLTWLKKALNNGSPFK